MLFLQETNQDYKNKVIKRGQIWFANLPNQGNSVQFGLRPVVIVSNDTCNKHSTIITVIPITSVHKKKGQPTHIYIENEKIRHSVVICEQIISISKKCLDNMVCNLDEKTMKRIETAMEIQVGIKIKKQHKKKPYKNFQKP